ncbi:hypothetical protein ACO0M4_30210 [Streptomyces sp. RGM 3693]|uniref:hypothetical protein n=1 Tax=Streptomyces sp. RGM 3693 TaxID=3413284 RepID=UPI003D2DC0F0
MTSQVLTVLVALELTADPLSFLGHTVQRLAAPRVGSCEDRLLREAEATGGGPRHLR